MLRKRAMVVLEDELMTSLSSETTRRLRLQVGQVASDVCHSSGYQRDGPSKVRGRQ